MRLRPNLAAAWYYLGRVNRSLERESEAADAYRRCLAIDSGHGRAYVEIGELFAELGERAEALRYLRHGKRFARDPRPVEEELARLAAP